MNVFFEADGAKLILSDAQAALAELEDCSVDAVVTDPPYGLEFMGKNWDAPWKTDRRQTFDGTLADDRDTPFSRSKVRNGNGASYGSDAAIMRALQEWHLGWARECLRILKPGGYLLAFGGARTYHRLSCAVEDAGFEIRDQIAYYYSSDIDQNSFLDSLSDEQKELFLRAFGRPPSLAWAYGSGFPKSLDVSKKLDAMERDYWLNVVNAIDKIEEWTKRFGLAKCAARLSERSQIAIGTSTEKRDSVLGDVPRRIETARLPLPAIIAELTFSGLHRTSEIAEIYSAQGNVDTFILPSSDPARCAGKLGVSQDATLTENIFTVQCDARELLSEKDAQAVRAEDRVTTSLGKRKLSIEMEENAVCAVLVDVWKRTILNRSKTFLNLDTTLQTECVCAMTATITKSTAENLILFTVGILKSKAIDKTEGVDRPVVRVNTNGSGPNRTNLANHAKGDTGIGYMDGSGKVFEVTAPGSEAAKQWSGWGTALKPSHEPIVVARKPLEGTVAANVQKWGTGAINIDKCRIPTTDGLGGGAEKQTTPDQKGNEGWTRPWMDREEDREAHAARVRQNVEKAEALGRWPANLIHDGSPEVLQCFPDAPGQLADPSPDAPPDRTKNCFGKMNREGEASAQKRYTEEGSTNFAALPGQRRFDSVSAARFFYCAKADSTDREEGMDGAIKNDHPTVKPVALMRYLCRLVTPPGGLILDPFAGSGTTLVAARREGFRSIGIEREKHYCEIGKARMSQGMLLFGAEEEF